MGLRRRRELIEWIFVARPALSVPFASPLPLAHRTGRTNYHNRYTIFFDIAQIGKRYSHQKT